MIAAPDVTTASPPRLFVGKRIPRPDLRLVLAGMAWLGLFLLRLAAAELSQHEGTRTFGKALGATL